LPAADGELSLYEFFSHEDAFLEMSPRELSEMAADFGVPGDFFYGEQVLKSLSGGEKVKAQLMRIIMANPTALLLDEPSNDIDIDTLELLEKLINGFKGIVLFISHDETLIENTANMVIHLEQVERKRKSRYTVCKMAYRDYVKERLHQFEKQAQEAENDRRQKKIREEKYKKVYDSVQGALENISKGARDGIGKNLKDKMHTVKAMGKRFERMDEEMTERPEQEEAIFFKLGNKDSAVPAGKTVLEYSLDKLTTPDGDRILARDIYFKLRGPIKLCIVGKNGCGKTTLIRKIAEELLARPDIRVQYMPQNYEDLLNMSATPVDFLDTTGDKEERTRIRTYLGSLKYTADEMDHPIGELSGGQKAKVFLLKMSLSDANVLILDEPTRNFSPLSGPVIREILRDFPGAIISISHDRKYIDEVCDTVYELTETGLHERQKES
ncbi:MAG: ABC-F family ATP-binding cassette domain-containing protein, partial [Lachnospiraceae bacterium]|nr:ABC-F family ATP-binding cassette domain-containing protein [Lachnospiraceae bacterium]